MSLPEGVFQAILLVSLIAVAARIYLWKTPVLDLPETRTFRWILIATVGSVLGFIAGTVGIGGGIYLVPIILISGLGTTKEASATGAGFILFNSVTGLIARAGQESLEWELILPLGLAVLIGGFAGSRLGAGHWEARWIQQVLGAIIIVAIVFLARALVLGR